MPIKLKGMTWNHARGVDPLVACSAQWRTRTGVDIEWERRSLQDFESYPVDELARQYDLIVIDHPHVGQVTREHCLHPFNAATLDELEQASIGASFASYRWQGQQWALPIDAATQVMAWRPDLLDAAPTQWEDVMQLAREGRVALPMRAPHSLMCLYTLCGQLGAPGAVEGPDLFAPHAAARAYDLLRELLSHVSPDCVEQDPIAVFERMAQPSSRIACVPLIYGYINYALEGFAPARIAFADIAEVEGCGPVGSALGGTGIAVSAYSRHTDEAVAFAIWVAGAEAQRDFYASADGQAGHAAAWADDVANAACLDFYRATRATLEAAWVRPRHDGYMAFQQAASDRLNAGLHKGEAGDTVIADLNDLFRESLPR